MAAPDPFAAANLPPPPFYFEELDAMSTADLNTVAKIWNIRYTARYGNEEDRTRLINQILNHNNNVSGSESSGHGTQSDHN